MIAECLRCGGAIPMDVDARTRYEDDECPRCRYVETIAPSAAAGAETEPETEVAH